MPPCCEHASGQVQVSVFKCSFFLISLKTFQTEQLTRLVAVHVNVTMPQKCSEPIGSESKLDQFKFTGIEQKIILN